MDWLLVVAMLTYAAGYMAVLGTRETRSPIGMLTVLAGVGGCLLLSRRTPFVAMLLTAGSFFLLVRTTDAHAHGPNSPDAVFVVIALMTYRLAVRGRPSVSGATAALLVVAQICAGSAINPFTVIGVAGPWAVGLAVRSRTSAQRELQARQRELESEQGRYNEESVRYERTRIARELHDVIAHNVSLMVVQASAGQFLPDDEPARTAEAFDTIAAVAHRAQDELAALVSAQSRPTSPGAALAMIDELIRSVSATGLAVTYRLSGCAPDVDAEVALTAYRVVQEGLTNAVKHAAGAPITVVLDQTASHLDVEVRNGPPTSDSHVTTLASSGGGHGLHGLRERVAGIRGTLSAEPTPQGGWRVVARLPLSPSAEVG